MRESLTCTDPGPGDPPAIIAALDVARLDDLATVQARFLFTT
jgi:hypothetical protein